eukprot:m.182905 g.182905  ORF g.182905 m.182905 type:complete len:71 (-) comp14679_c0_seq1:69-281(-)
MSLWLQMEFVHMSICVYVCAGQRDVFIADLVLMLSTVDVGECMGNSLLAQSRLSKLTSAQARKLGVRGCT